MQNKLKFLTAVIAACLASAPVQAVQFDGFLTAGATILDDRNQNLTDYQGITNDFRFDTDSRFGLQISSEISKDMSVVGQLLAAGDNENFNAIIEWAYVDYQLNKAVSIRSGKIKQPVYLVNDYVEVGYAYPWIRPPTEVYSNNPLNTVNGMEVLIQLPIGKNILSFQPYIGTNSEIIPGTGGAGSFEATNILGMDIKFTGRGYSFHVSHFQTDVSTQGNFIAQADLSGGTAPGFIDTVSFDLAASGNAMLTSAGFTADINNFVAYAEWQSRDEQGGLDALFPDQDSYYATLGYRIGKWLPHITFAGIDGEAGATNANVACGNTLGCTSPTSGTNGIPNGTSLFPGQFPFAEQTSITGGVRYELNDSAALKMEYQVVDVKSGSFGLFTPSFSSAPTSKTIGIGSIALDVIF